MKSISKIIFLFINICVVQLTFALQNDCNYKELQKPTDIPRDFDLGVLQNMESFKFNVELRKCNEIYFTSIAGSENIYVAKKENGTWNKPVIASFSDPKYNDADPVLSSDGNKIYFISKRPTHDNDKNLDFNIWYAKRVDSKWTAPKPLPKPINSDDSDEYMLSVSNKNNVFFSSNRKGGEGSFDIYTAKINADGTFSNPENLGKPINTPGYEFDPYISPDERFIIFSINKNGNSDLYYSYKNENNQWTSPKNLGAKINTTRQDFAPSLSADGKYLFYSNNGKLKWVSINILQLPEKK